MAELGRNDGRGGVWRDTRDERWTGRLSVGELVSEISQQVSLLVKKQVELARTEIKADLKTELAAVGGLSFAAIVVLAALNMLLVAAAFALALVLPGWAAALIVAGALIVIALVAAGVSWRRRVREPMARTLASLKDDVQWTKRRFT